MGFKGVKIIQACFRDDNLFVLRGTSYVNDAVDFICVEVLRPSQPNRVMSSAVSLPNYTLTGQA